MLSSTMYRRLPGTFDSVAYSFRRPQPWVRLALVAACSLLVGCSLVVVLSTNALLLYGLSHPSPSPFLFFARPPRLLYEWTDPKLVDSRSERALAQACSFDSPLDHLALWPALQNATELPKPPPSGLLNITVWSEGEGWHPLLLLIKDGEERFKAKLAAQSRTLAEAEAEYRRRNAGRRPPPGFEVWWNFATSHGVLFPDEHGSTELLKPFHALSPTERRRRLELASREARDDAVIGSPRQALVRITNGPEGLTWAPLKTTGGRSGFVPREARMQSRTKAHLALLQPIQHLLPNFTFVLNNADQPVVLLDPKAAGEMEDPSEPAGHQINWRASCDRRNNASAWPGTADDELAQSSLAAARAQRKGVTFVQDVRRSSDPCANLNLLEQHGFYLQDTGGPNPDLLPLTHRQLLPVISLSSTPRHSDLLGVPVGIEGRIERVGSQDVDWEKKVDQVYWRGSATGMYNHAPATTSESPRWLQAHRPRLSLFANDRTASPASPVELDGRTGGVRAAPATRGVEWKRWLNVHLASSIFWRMFSWWPETGQQCDWWDGTCRSLGWRYSYVGKDPSSTSDLFKFALDVDGNAWSARFPRLLASKSLVIKSTAFTEWNGGTFPAWYGYIPSQNDYADLESILAFLHEPGMDEVARRMALIGRCYKARSYRVVDMQAYLLRLYIEMASLFSEEEA